MAPADASPQPGVAAVPQAEGPRDPTALVVVAILDLVLIGPVVGLALAIADAIANPAPYNPFASGGFIAFVALVVALTAAGLVLGLLSRAPGHRVRYLIALACVVLAVPVALLVGLVVP